MVVLIVLLTVVVFLVVDLSLRLALKKREEAKRRREREAALDIGLRLDFTEQAPSLKRVEVENPKARILAVDDEPVVLDSFRRILVLEGYSVDTVESGPEALGLVRKNDYDFVYTDLKMPEMDGVDLTKAVRHLRPDIDVVIITGFATIESAVETMRFGAMDYVEKPFTADELAEFTRKCAIRRQDRIERQSPPRVHLVTPTSGESSSPRVINVPGGIYVSPQHTWVGIQINGQARIGLDDLALKSLMGIEGIEFPARDRQVRKGEPLFSIVHGDRSLTFPSPISGRVTAVNHDLVHHLELLRRRPFALGWICAVEPKHLTPELAELRIGADAVEWYEGEIDRFGGQLEEAGSGPGLPAADSKETHEAEIRTWWRVYEGTFLSPTQREPVPA